MLLTDSHTNQQTNATQNINSFAKEVKMIWFKHILFTTEHDKLTCRPKKTLRW